ncbi:MAG: FdhF/YdeP family oxidoreductase [Deltaproteobacteria bacterium]|nr:FdhF/YdeP family oxidoreductase [Deltaproteobacteria bacterium]
MSDDGNDDKSSAAGLGAVLRTLRRTIGAVGITRSAHLLSRINQEGGFDCPGCAWPESGDRSFAEFCENGAKAVSHEATTATLTPEFFRQWPVSRLGTQSDHWLEAQGRLAQPMIKRAGSDIYEPIEWDAAFAQIGAQLRALPSPDEAVFYTSGRTSNEAAFLYQLFVREFGTNNLPDCSNMCHESTSTALAEVIGVGKGTVSLDDFALADLILILGQNPGTNHPRMMITLQRAKERGARIVSINPLRELGLVRFSNPQRPRDLLGHSTELTDLYLQVRIGGDVALLKGIIKHVFEAELARPGKVLDHGFLATHTDGIEALRDDVTRASWEELEAESGIDRARMREVSDLYIGSGNVIACWAMGLTQHKHGVANVREVTNLLLLRGNIGKAGAGLCPVRGHSNVQGDRTMGICERPSAEFLDRLRDEFGFEPPRPHGYDTVETLRAMLAGRVQVFVAMGGNFAAATPDSGVAVAALARCVLTVQISTKLNRSHLVTGETAILLPTLGRTERDVQRSGPQFVSVEDSMSMIHRSRGELPPASPLLRSEPAIVAGLARATLGKASRVHWEELAADYDRVRDAIARVVPGFEDFNLRIRSAGGFRLRNGARERRFKTDGGRAKLTVNPLTRRQLAPGRLLLMTIRSHDQFNTTIYGLDDRYRGVYGDRRVVLLNPDDIAAARLTEGERVDLRSEFEGTTRSVSGFRVVPYQIPRGCAAAYFPEANPLVALESFADGSRTPAYKSIVITLARSGAAPTDAATLATNGDTDNPDDGEKR